MPGDKSRWSKRRALLRPNTSTGVAEKRYLPSSSILLTAILTSKEISRGSDCPGLVCFDRHTRRLYPFTDERTSTAPLEDHRDLRFTLRPDLARLRTNRE